MTHLPDHRLTLTWNGERGSESTSTASCICGWEESASNQRECRFEYRQHLASQKKKQSPLFGIKPEADRAPFYGSRDEDGL